MRTPLQRWAAKVVLPTQRDGCWLWTGFISCHGYGQATANHRGYLVHRYAYERFVGPIPPGLTIDHLCRNRACVNPDHLQPTTHQENILRGIGITAQFARRTHCNHGHPFDAANTVWQKTLTGRRYRRCRECRNRRKAA